MHIGRPCYSMRPTFVGGEGMERGVGSRGSSIAAAGLSSLSGTLAGPTLSSDDMMGCDACLGGGAGATIVTVV